jgi:hypothetical protein
VLLGAGFLRCMAWAATGVDGVRSRMSVRGAGLNSPRPICQGRIRVTPEFLEPEPGD